MLVTLQEMYIEDLLLAVLYFSGVNFVKTDSNFSKSDIDFVKVMHREFCPLSQVCVPLATEPRPPIPPPPIVFENDTDIAQKMLASPLPYPPSSNMYDGSCCKDCSCDLDSCTLSGTCCPELFDYLPSVEDSASGIKIVCQQAAMKKTPRTPRGQMVWMFTKCADGYKGDPLTKDKCENPDRFTGWDIITLVATNGTVSAYYQNIHCALCNNVSKTDIVNWDVSLECLSSTLVPSSMETLIDEVNEIPDCNLVYKYPFNDMSVKECKPPEISECNITGNWKVYDPVKEAACYAYTALYEGKYKNIFCFLCNEAEPYEIPSRCKDIGGGPVWPSFSALLKFTLPQADNEELDEEANNGCKQTQISDTCKVSL